MFKFEHGDEVKDNVTKFKGIVTSRADYYNGCIRYGVESEKLVDDKQQEIWFDESRLELVKTGKKKPAKKKNHGPRKDPTRI